MFKTNAIFVVLNSYPRWETPLFGIEHLSVELISDIPDALNICILFCVIDVNDNRPNNDLSCKQRNFRIL